MFSESAYNAIIDGTEAVIKIKFGDKGAADTCWSIFNNLGKTINEIGLNDVGLTTYSHKIASIIEEKWSSLSEFERIRSESSEDGGKQANMLGFLSFFRGQLFGGKSQFMGQMPEQLRTGSGGPRVSIQDFEIVKKISGGAYGKVFLARKKKTKDLYAVKVLQKNDMRRKNMIESVISERRILANVRNKCTVQLYYAFQNETSLFLVMEYCCGGDLATLLKNIGPFQQRMARAYIGEIAMALECLHNVGYVHRDLKPDNILVDAKGHLLLTDFGLSSIGVLEEIHEPAPLSPRSPRGRRRSAASAQEANLDPSPAPVVSHMVGTPDYLAPEILLGTGHGPEVDWWALGIMLFEFLTGIPPFNGDTVQEIFDKILLHEIPWEKGDLEEGFGIDKDSKNLIEGLLERDPKQRLGHNGLAEVQVHPFFDGIDWKTLTTEDREDLFVPTLDDAEDTGYFEDHSSKPDSCSHGSNPADEFSKSIRDVKAIPGFDFMNTEVLAKKNLDMANEAHEADSDSGTDSYGELDEYDDDDDEAVKAETSGSSPSSESSSSTSSGSSASSSSSSVSVKTPSSTPTFSPQPELG